MAFLFGKKDGRKRTLGEFEIGETIGEGTTSKVKLGREIRSGRLVALKIMHPEVFRSRQVQQELEILRYFGEPRNRHPNICGLVTVLHDVEYKSKHGIPQSSYESKRVSVIVTDYLDGGDLFSYVAAGIPFNEEAARAVMQQVVRGVSHLHKHGVVHLDLKPENILIGKNGIIKITDFGLSEIVKPLRSKRKNPSSGGHHNHSHHQHKSSNPRSNGGGIRSVVSLNSLESLAESVDSSFPSPLTTFFPSSNKIFTQHRPSSGSIGSGSFEDEFQPERELENEEEGTIDSPHSDAELFEAISSGRTRESYASSDDVTGTPSNSFGGLRASLSNSNLSSLETHSQHRMGGKVSSFNSISSLDSTQSYGSRWSKESKSSTTSRFRTPRLVVNSRSGTLCYQAPEVNFGNYDGCKADVFSLGIVLHVMLYGVLPFDGTDSYGSDISSGSDSDVSPQEWTEPLLLKQDIILSEDAVDLLRNMLRLDPKTRFSLKDAMRQVWVHAAQVRGSVQKVAALVKRREHYVIESRKNQSYLRKARKRGLGLSMRTSESEIFG